jgi:Rap1a immunity proteins
MERELPYAGVPRLDSWGSTGTGLCRRGYVRWHYFWAGLHEFLPPDASSCRPQGVTTGQMVRVVVAYIERRPERMHEDFRRLAIEAWHEAWPCM